VKLKASTRPHISRWTADKQEESHPIFEAQMQALFCRLSWRYSLPLVLGYRDPLGKEVKKTSTSSVLKGAWWLMSAVTTAYCEGYRLLETLRDWGEVIIGKRGRGGSFH